MITDTIIIWGFYFVLIPQRQTKLLLLFRVIESNNYLLGLKWSMGERGNLWASAQCSLLTSELAATTESISICITQALVQVDIASLSLK